MLTPEQIADGWKPHDGGPCPVEGPCEIMQRHGHVSKIGKPKRLDWGFTLGERKYDIIAYKEQSNG